MSPSGPEFDAAHLGLRAADRRRPPRGGEIQRVGEHDRLLEQRDDPIRRAAVEEVLVAHAPRDDAGVVAVDADHVRQAREDVGVERVEVGRRARVGAVVGPASRTAEAAPEVVFGPEQQAELVAGVCKRRRLRIVRAADEVHPGVLDHFDVAGEGRVRHAVAPARVILVKVRALHPVVRAVQGKALRCRPAEPTKPEGRREFVDGSRAVRKEGQRPVHGGMVGVP